MMFWDDPFAMLITTIASLAILGPFGIFGIYRFREWLSGWFKIRSGHIRVRQKLPNDRWQIFWKKPEGRKISLKSQEGKNTDIPIKLEKDFVGWEGSVPFIEIDDNFQQMPLNRTKLTIPKEHSTRMSYLAYLAGKIAGMKEETRLQLFLLIAIVVMIGVAGLVWWTTNGLSNDVSDLADQVAALRPATGQAQQSQIPTAG